MNKSFKLHAHGGTLRSAVIELNGESLHGVTAVTVDAGVLRVNSVTVSLNVEEVDVDISGFDLGDVVQTAVRGPERDPG